MRFISLFFLFSWKKEEDAEAFLFNFACKMGTSSCIQTILAVVQSRGKWKCRSSRNVLDPQYRKREKMEENRKHNRLLVNKFSYLTGADVSLQQSDTESDTLLVTPPLPSPLTHPLLNWPTKQTSKSKIRQTELRRCHTPIPPGCNSHHLK